MVATWADDIFKCNFVNENVSFLTTNSQKFVPKGPIDNKWSLAQVKIWCRTGVKPLPEPKLTQFNDVYMR